MEASCNSEKECVYMRLCERKIENVCSFSLHSYLAAEMGSYNATCVLESLFSSDLTNMHASEKDGDSI